MSIIRPLEKLSEIPVSLLALWLLTILLQGCTATNNSQSPDPPPGDQTAPTAPGSLTASAKSGTQINLTWAASSDNVGVTGYRVERCSGASCSSFAQVGTSATTTYADSGLSGSTSYTYRVRAADAAGNLSGYSNTSSATTQSPGDSQPPSAPAALTAAASSHTQIGLTWTASTDNVGLTGYRVERCVGNGCVSFAQVAAVTVVGFGDNGLLSGTTYGYRVRATDEAGNLSSYSNISYATTTGVGDTQAPTAPSSLTATASSSSQIGLSWTASTDNVGVTGYDIERCAGASCTSFAQIGTTGGATTFTDSGLTGSTTFRYRVRTSDAAGNLSTYSNIASATTSAATDTQAPTAPSGLAAAASSSSQIGLSWAASTDNVGVTGYRIERCVGASCTTFAQIGTTTGATTFSDSGLTASTSYSYRVRATDAAGNLSGYSNLASATTNASADIQAPTAPSGLAATASSSSQIGLSWAASTDNVGVTGYRIERCAGASCTTFAQIGTTTGATTFGDSGLTASTSYSYRVRATDAAGNLSGYSNLASAITSSSGGGSITVSVSPKRGGLTTSQTLRITATLTNDTANQGVTWSFASTGSTSGGGFSSTSSTSGNEVRFTAPSGAGVVTITATAVADNTKTATATVGVTDLGGVLTYHNNLSRDGTNQKEYALTPSNVTTGTFGKLFSCTADGALYAQPLWIPKVSIGVGGGTHNVILAASMRDTVYAYDADASPCTTYWSKTLIPSGETWGSYSDVGSSDIFPDIGILGTPVIDPSTSTIYLIAKTKTSAGFYHQRLHALSLSDGSEKFGGPVDLTSAITAAGTGDNGDNFASCTSSNGVPFCPLRENQRPGLVLNNGVVYVAWASHGDQGIYHGWILGFSASNLTQVSKFNSAPNGRQGGIWMSGGAPAVDSGGNLYAATGNGNFDGITDFGDSVLRLSSTLALSDYFTPHNQSNLDADDADQGSGGTTLLIDQASGPIPRLMVIAGKSGAFYVLNRDHLGHFNAAGDGAAVQSWTGARSFSTPAFWNNTMYFFGVNFGQTQPGQQYAFAPSTGVFATTPTGTTPTGLGFPGATPSISARANSNGIVWVIDSSAFGTRDSGSRLASAAVLHAYDASDISSELWNSTQGSGNAAGFAVKFTVPTVANGKVYVGTRGNDNSVNPATVLGQLDVYGLLPD